MLERIGAIPDGSPRARAVGRRIGRLLLRRSWSEAELAEAMAVPEETVRGIVRGEHLDGEEIAGCAEALGATVEEIVGERERAGDEAGETGAEVARKATEEEAAEIRRRLRSEGEAGAGAPPVSDEELHALLRWMVDEALAAQDRIERERSAQVAAADLPSDPVADDDGREDGR